MAEPEFDCDVLVVGLGPVGAAIAALLAQRGVRVLAIDCDTEVYPLPRAVHLDHEIMRILQQLGVADAVLEDAMEVPDYEFRTADGRLLMRLKRAEETPSGWAAGYMFHQPTLERALRGNLAASPHAQARLGWRFTGLSQDGEAVTAELETPDGRAAVRARYLVGCDGGASPVRRAIGGGLFDYQFDEPWLVVDVKAPDEAHMPKVLVQVCDPERPTSCVTGGRLRRRWEFMLLPGETAEEMLRDETIRALIARTDPGPVEIERKAVYRFHGLVAERWRSGRVLLAGDAAHQTPPFAGQGMCAGLRDAANLAWKLEAVLTGAAGDHLLDTYQAEREPHARAYIELAIGMGRLVCTTDREAAAARDAEMLARIASGAPPLPPLRPPPFAVGCLLPGSPGAGALFPQPCVGEGAGRLRMDDVLDGRAWLVTRTAQGLDADDVQVLPLDCESLAPFRTALETWLDQHGVEAALVRPDRYVFGAGEAQTLLAAWRKSLVPLRHAA